MKKITITHLRTKMISAGIALSTMLTPLVAYAEDANPAPTLSSDAAETVTKATNVLDTFSEALRQIATPLAVLALGACGIMYIFANSAQEGAKIKSWIIKIVIGIGLLYFAQTFVKTVINIVQ